MSSLQSYLVPVPGAAFLLKITVGNAENSVQPQINSSSPSFVPIKPAVSNQTLIPINVVNLSSDVQTSEQSADKSTSLSGQIEENPTNLVCDICHKSLSSKRNLLRHVEMHSRSSFQQHKNNPNDTQFPSEMDPKDSCFICCICDKTLASKRSMLRHLEMHSRMSSESQQKKLHQTNQSLKSNDVDMEQCKDSKESISNMEMSQKLGLSSESKDLNSNSVSSQNQKSLLELLVSDSHQEKCSDGIQGMETAVQSSQKSNSNTYHVNTSERRSACFKCNLCKKGLTTKHSLRRHLESHARKSFLRQKVSQLLIKVEDSSIDQCAESIKDSDLKPQNALPPIADSGLQQCTENTQESDTNMQFLQESDDLVLQRGVNENNKSSDFLCKVEPNLPSRAELAGSKEIKPVENFKESASSALETEQSDDMTICDPKISKKKRLSLQCQVCSKILSSTRNLVRHVELHASESSCVCDICKKIFKSQDLLKKHYVIHDDEKPIVCPTCNKIFKKKQYYYIHQRVHTCEKLFACDVCNKTFNVISALKRHLSSHTFDKTFSCNQCPKDFTSPEDWKHHYTYHAKPHSCQICGKRFRKKSSLEAHTNIHNNHMPFSCDICQKAFPSKLYLQNHVRIHSQNKPFSCDICHKAFFKRRDVEVHYRIHTGEKPHFCDYCDKKFTTVQSLKLHRYSHTGKPHECEVCHKRFPLKSHLVRHSHVHTGARPYVCDLCSSAFATRKTLFRHYRVHTGEKPFVCEICQKGFTQRSNLLVHQYVHSDEKPYTCELCPKKYTTKQSLNFHMNTHKNENL